MAARLVAWVGFAWPAASEEEALVTIQAVVFDIGETLLDDSREFGAWADWLDVPRHTFSAVLGAATAEGRDNAETFQYLRPGFDVTAERQRREDAGPGDQPARRTLRRGVPEH